MIIALISLTAISVLALIAGFIWVLIISGETTERRGKEVGAELVSEQMVDEDEVPIVQKAAFHGEAVEVKRETTVQFSEIKEQIKNGNWRGAFPWLLVMGGFLGLLLFGSLSLLVLMENKLIGGFIVAVVLITVGRIVIRWIKA